MVKIETKEIKFIDLFGGVGGFRLGLERASNEKLQFKCVFYSDIDKYAVQTYNKNFGESHEAEDIRNVRADQIPKHDLICGGFPCQSFSIAGKRRGFKDTRGTLFYEICRIAKFHRPKMLFLENVKGLLNHDRGETFRTILESLHELGYFVEWQMLNSKDFGVPQNRERVFIIGHLGGEPRRKVFPIGQSCSENNGTKREIKYIQNSSREMKRIYDIEGIAPTIHLKTGGWQEPKIAISNASKKEFKWQTERSPTLLSRDYKEPKTLNSSCGRDQCVNSIRRLTPIECERLQGFPDNWTEGVSDTQRYKQMGNAVTVNVIQAIGERILKCQPLKI